MVAFFLECLPSSERGRTRSIARPPPAPYLAPTSHHALVVDEPRTINDSDLQPLPLSRYRVHQP
jgi:hypothetical protein